jgi:hypothetical protein
MLKWDIDGERRIDYLIPIAVGENRIAFSRRSVKAGGNRNARLRYAG